MATPARHAGRRDNALFRNDAIVVELSPIPDQDFLNDASKL
jgi:hypothetical protein